jgi:hypothetical protein
MVVRIAGLPVWVGPTELVAGAREVLGGPTRRSAWSPTCPNASPACWTSSKASPGASVS